MLTKSYGPAPKLDAQPSSLLALLAHLNEHRLAMGLRPATVIDG